MFIGFPPFSKKSFYLYPLTPGHFLVTAIEAAQKLGWKIDKITADGFFARITGDAGNTRNEIKLEITGDKAELTVQSNSGFLDFGISAATRKFNEIFVDLKYDLKKEELDSRWQNLQKEIQPVSFQNTSATDPSPENEAGDKRDIPLEADLAAVEVPKKKNRFEFLHFFIPAKGFWATPVLIDLNILLFILQAANGVNILLPDAESLISWGGNIRALTLGGQWWRLLTNCFLHIGVLHLLMNMYALLYIGIILEPIIGSRRFGFAYILTGLLASVTSVCWHENIISAGASGAIFGMYGIFVALLLTNLADKNMRKEQLTSMLIFIAYNLLYGLKGGIDNAAHIGGLISGLITGFSFYPLLKQPDLKSRNSLVVASVTFVMLSVSLYVMVNTSNPVGNYTRILNEFAAYEEKALSVYKLPQYSGDEKILSEIENSGIPNWMKCKEIVDSAGKIQGLPEDLNQRIVLLKRYCDYRVKSFNLMRTSIREQNTGYRMIIEQYNQRIDLIIKKLNGENIPDSDLEYKPDLSIFNTGSPSLYVVDGIIVNNIDSIDEKDIKDFRVLKAEAAMTLYGEKGRNGVIIINTWEGSTPTPLIINP